MIRKIALTLLPALLMLCSCNKTHFDKAKLDSYLDTLNTRNLNMGSIAISENGTIVYQKATGYSELGDHGKFRVDIKTRYKIGSITKMFTAVMIFQLVEEGKLKLNTTLDKYFPQVPNAGKITVAEMLDHRSGLYNFVKDSLYAAYYRKPMPESAMVDIFSKQKAAFEPDSKAEYSNTNFVLLGYIIEKITGKSYSDELKQRITAKIGLEDTHYEEKSDPSKNIASSYNYSSQWMQAPETDPSIPGGAGSIVSTPTDLVKFIDALFSGKLISKANLENMKTMKENYGMAMFSFSMDGQDGYGHTGGIDGFSSELVYIPATRTAIAYTSNGARYPVYKAATDVLRIYNNKAVKIPEFKTVTLNSAILDKYLGRYNSTDVPWKLTIIKNNNTLIGQTSDGMPYPLDAIDNDKFIHHQTGITLYFDTTRHTLKLTQGDSVYFFTKTK